MGASFLPLKQDGVNRSLIDLRPVLLYLVSMAGKWFLWTRMQNTLDSRQEEEKQVES